MSEQDIAQQETKESKTLAVRAKNAFVSVVDRNGNGKIDAADFGIDEENLHKSREKAKHLAASAVQAARDGAAKLGEAISTAKMENDMRILRPAFKETLYGADDVPRTPSLICIAERDKKRDAALVCAGAVGYWTMVKGMDILNLYEDSAQEIGISFVPNVAQTFYYIDPYKQNVYVSLDSFFDYFKKERVNELEVIAQDLGAKNVRITFKEHKKSFVKKSGRANAKAGNSKMNAKAEAGYDNTDKEFSQIEIAADVHFRGREKPQTPSLLYFRSESDIEKLIQMRMNPENPITSKDYRFQCSKTSGMSEKTAAKIDGVLQHLKCTGSATVSSEVQRENRTELEYHIEF